MGNMELELKDILMMIKKKEISKYEGLAMIKKLNSNTGEDILMEEADGVSSDEDIKKNTIILLKDIFAQEMRTSSDNIKPTDAFEHYGIDSFMITRMNRRLEDIFGDISKTIFFEYGNLIELAEYFSENYKDIIISKTNMKQNVKQKVKPTPTPIQSKRAEINVKKSNIETKNKDMNNEEYSDDDIAIIGIDGRYPMSPNLDAFWKNISQGKDCIREIPQERWDYKEYFTTDKNELGKSYSKWGGFLEDIDKFDPLFFNISPKEAELIDPQERLFLETSWNTIEDAGYTRQDLRELSVGVFAGVMYGEYQLLGIEEFLKGNDLAVWQFYASIANRVSYLLNLKGPSISIDTMCSSSLTAIHLACSSIHKGECDMAIAGGVNLSVHPNKYVMLSQSNFLSSEGKCRAFGEGGDGYVPGEGVGALLLRPLKKAIENKDNIYGIIKATSINHDGKTNGFTVPNPNAQRDVILTSIQNAGIDPRTISYMEAHGTGTSLGDPIEITGLNKAFSQYTKEKQYCPIGSIKANIGHLESAAAISGITKIILQMKHKKLAPSILSETLNPNIDFNKTPFYVQHKLEEWNKPSIEMDGESEIYPRIAALSSFGAGGSNSHIIIQEYEAEDKTFNNQELNQPVLILLSAKNEERLKAYAKKLILFIEGIQSKEEIKQVNIHDIAYTLQVGREAFEERIAFIATQISDIDDILKKYLNNETNMNNFYAGNIKKGLKIGLSVEVNDANLLDLFKNDLQTLACHWVAGNNVDFKEFYEQSSKPRRISLPTYPFLRKKYWISNDKAKETSSSNHINIEKIHPLLDKNISTLLEQKFSTYFTGNEFYIRDHIVSGKKFLPGVACIEMARIATEISLEESPVSIKDVTWIKPVDLTNESLEVQSIISITEEEEIRFKIVQRLENEEVIYSQGSIEIEPDEEYTEDMLLDIDYIEERCLNKLNKDEIYKMFNECGLQYGESFQPIEMISSNEDECIAYLELPAQLDENFEEYILHPSILDGALQSVLGVILNPQDNQQYLYLPYSLGSLEIVKSLDKNCYVYVEMISNKNSTNPLKQFNIKITDTQGNILVNIRNFSLTQVQKNIFSESTYDISENENKKQIFHLLQKLYNGEMNDEQVIETIGGGINL